jgi:2-keto-3-deoxy-L-rhamnonate aldolase RhmA
VPGIDDRNRSFLSKLKAQPTVGVVLQSASPLVANSMSAAGFDWLVIDPINSPLSQLESFAMQTAVGDGNPPTVFMRVGGPIPMQARGSPDMRAAAMSYQW